MTQSSLDLQAVIARLDALEAELKWLRRSLLSDERQPGALALTVIGVAIAAVGIYIGKIGRRADVVCRFATQRNRYP
jgi:hypothetical protein